VVQAHIELVLPVAFDRDVHKVVINLTLTRPERPNHSACATNSGGRWGARSLRTRRSFLAITKACAIELEWCV
jgi:hypothetical protein